MAKEKTIKKSISMPRSMARLVDQRRRGRIPRLSRSGYFQEIVARDLREAGLLPAESERIAA